MKRLIVLLTLIYSIFCSFDSCVNCNDESQCYNIDIEFNGFSCYKYKSEYASNKCLPSPDDKKEQETFFNMDLNNLKEVYSSGLFILLISMKLDILIQKKKLIIKVKQ